MQRNAYHMSILKNNFDPVQRQNQWKQRVTAEERLLGENKMKALLAHEHIHHYDTLADPVASKGVFDERGRLALPLSSRPISSVGRMLSTSRSDLSTARSSVSNTSSLNSTTSNMTAIALERLDRLEQVNIYSYTLSPHNQYTTLVFCLSKSFDYYCSPHLS